MTFASSMDSARGLERDPTRFDSEVVELPLLLPRWQALALETAARNRGVTTAAMLRRLVGDMLRSGNAE